MSSSGLHFLTLPREIRNIIYDYLTQQVELDWGYELAPFPVGGHVAAKLVIPDAPLPSMLRVCSRVYEEYRQAKCFRRLTIKIDARRKSRSHLLENMDTNRARVASILEHAWCVQIVFEPCSEEDEVDGDGFVNEVEKHLQNNPKVLFICPV